MVLGMTLKIDIGRRAIWTWALLGRSASASTVVEQWRSWGHRSGKTPSVIDALHIDAIVSANSGRARFTNHIGTGEQFLAGEQLTILICYLCGRRCPIFDKALHTVVLWWLVAEWWLLKRGSVRRLCFWNSQQCVLMSAYLQTCFQMEVDHIIIHCVHLYKLVQRTLAKHEICPFDVHDIPIVQRAALSAFHITAYRAISSTPGSFYGRVIIFRVPRNVAWFNSRNEKTSTSPVISIALKTITLLGKVVSIFNIGELCCIG